MSIVSGNYQNVASYSLGAIISKKNDSSQGFVGGNDGSCLRDTIYLNYIFLGFTWSGPGISINILLMQKYLLNTLKIWLWDRGSQYGENDRFYKIIVYAKLGLIQNKIYESDVAISVITIKFPDQFVQEFRVLNVGGNTYNVGLHVIKAEALLQFNHEI